MKTIHPFLFAAYPILFLYAHNIDQVPLMHVLYPLTHALFFTLLLYLATFMILGDKNKTSVMVSLTVVLFFSFAHSMALMDYMGVKATLPDAGINISAQHKLEMQSMMEQTHRSAIVYIIYLILLVASFILLKTTEKNLEDAVKIFNVISLALILIPACSIIIFLLTHNPDYTIDEESKLGDESYVTNQPDIYYIIIDEYGRADYLKRVFGFNNTEFIQKLEDRGFYVASSSRSNYPITYLSLASSLNMKYIENLDENSRDCSIPYQMIKNNNVSAYLKALGYKYINMKSTWGPTDDMGADLELGYGGYELGEFYIVLLQSTALQPFIEELIGRDLRKSRLYVFDKIKEIPELRESTYTFAHIMLPHPPYLFDRMGNAVTQKRLDLNYWEMSEEYVNQLVYTNKLLMETIDEVLASSDTAPIIILQADHGTQSIHQHHKINIHNLTKDQLNERMAIFNAFYLPDGKDTLLYDSITPVNTFRIIFNSYFNGNYTLLEDKSFFSNVYYPYDFMIIPPEDKLIS
ncbi:MAG: hypothetical protein B6U97_04945 [Candidatus Altiarchaeales archaeon ex4484_96]|nr:MAG: hypothetical protein B6U97_04945 [Candidatus Altiarchaeales archaeon ex4484_96]